MTDEMDAGSVQENRSDGNTFSSLTLDRAARRRQDGAWIAEQLEAPTTRFLPIWGSKVFVTNEAAPRPVWLGPAGARELLRQAESVILLGESEEHTYVALGLPTPGEPPPAGLAQLGAFERLRAVAALLDRGTAALLAYAKAMVHYHHGHRFCAACGSPTASEEGGHLRVCTNACCGRQDFPRTDPAIIVLVSSGERCLLGR